MRWKLLSRIEFVKQIRIKRYIKRHQKVANYWDPVIKKYFSGQIKKWDFAPKKPLQGKKIIWQYWGQGVTDREALPEVVRICFDSVDKYKGEYEVIRLSDETVKEYLDLPDFTYEKVKNKSPFNRTFFSDLLRVSLLTTYGGVWLDATILLTGELPDKYTQMDYFMHERSDEEEHKDYWEHEFLRYFCWHKDFKIRLLNSAIFAKQGSVMTRTIQDLLLYYWEHENKIINYYFFQILYTQLVEGPLSDIRCPNVNDCIPHIIQTKIYSYYPYYTYKDATNLTSIHKMSYFPPKKMDMLYEALAEINEETSTTRKPKGRS